jgi:quinolinate synthase
MAVPFGSSSHASAERDREQMHGSVAESTYGRPRGAIWEAEWLLFEPLIADIGRLKIARKAIILAHNYQTPDIFHGVADIQGDSLALAREAADSDAEVIVVCGVRFMAETAKLLNPHRTVLLPDAQAGCSLAEAIGPGDVRELRRRHPGVPVVCYVNTSAAVKAECDVCCTSANAVSVVDSLGAERVILLPDEYLARYVASQTEVDIISWHGHCEVHTRFKASDVAEYRALTGAYVLAHPECPDDVQRAADYVGSTSGMIAELAARRPGSALLLTECSMSDNVAAVHPEIHFLRPCHLCPHMKRITLAKIRECLERLRPQVEVPGEVAVKAQRAVLRMLELTSPKGATSPGSAAASMPGGLVGA